MTTIILETEPTNAWVALEQYVPDGPNVKLITPLRDGDDQPTRAELQFRLNNNPGYDTPHAGMTIHFDAWTTPDPATDRRYTIRLSAELGDGELRRLHGFLTYLMSVGKLPDEYGP